MGRADIIGAFRAARERERPAVVAFVMAGDPRPGDDLEAAGAAVLGGADVIEVGWPFSDPIADGPSVQAAAARALRAGTGSADVLRLTSRVKRELRRPVALLTYMNPLLSLPSLERLAEAGVDALVVPDLPLEESHDLRQSLLDLDISLVPFAAPTSGPSRLAAVAGAAGEDHFVYLVAVMGVTGQRAQVSKRLGPLLRQARDAIRAPIAVGFGMGSPEAVASVRGVADGVIVGSALVDALAKDGPEGVRRLVGTLVAAAGGGDGT